MKDLIVMDPIHQFEIKNFFPLVRIGGAEIAFTNSALFMLIGLSLILFLMLGATRSRALVPGRLQSVAEMSYEFVANTLRSTAGTEGMKFFPLVFSLFMFILVLNVIGIIPYTFTVTSHHHHGCACASRLFHGGDLWLLEARSAFLQVMGAERSADLHHAVGDVHRGAVISVAACLP
jgi:F0F1-type ATP synthase membrane subunit a